MTPENMGRPIFCVLSFVYVKAGTLLLCLHNEHVYWSERNIFYFILNKKMYRVL